MGAPVIPSMTSVHTAAAVAIRHTPANFSVVVRPPQPVRLAGCDGPPPNATRANPPAASPDTGVVRLTAEKMKAAGITVQPLQRGEFRTFRDFPGTVEPNEHALADITTLVRGRVIDVYADLGREVKGGTSWRSSTAVSWEWRNRPISKRRPN